MSWQVLVAVVVGLLVAGFVAVLLICRGPFSHRIRFGVFVERETRSGEKDD